jgi:spore germination protein YaaH
VKTLALVANSPDDAAPAWHELTARALGQLLPGKTGTEWDGNRVGRTIREDASRARHIADLVALAETNGFDGINIDYEELGRDDREAFSRFIQELGAALHERGKILAVGLHPKTSEGDPRETNGSEAQDWNAIEPAADQLHFITYGEYVPRLEPGPTGPIASPGWIHAVMDYALNVRKLPREKIFIGVGLYAESWYRVGARRYVGEGLELTYEDILTLEQSFKGERHWHEESASPYLSYRDPEGYWRVVWFEDARSVREKLRLRSELGICNVGVWRLGGEDPAVWSELATPPIESSLSSNDLELDRRGEPQ